MKKVLHNGDAPATQNDFAVLGGHLSEVAADNYQSLSGRIDAVEETQGKHSRILGDILEIVTEIQIAQKVTQEHTEMLQKHEQRITDVEVQVRMMRR